MISAVVMAHKDRIHHARALAADVGARIVWDRGLGENDTGDRAWQATSLDADWAVVLQDDAVPVPYLLQTLQAGLRGAPRTCVGLYVGTSYPQPSGRVSAGVEEARRRGASWLEHPSLLWGVGVAIPVEHVGPMLEFVEHSTLPYDRRIGSYFKHIKRPVRYTFPSLVDHRDEPTLLSPADGPRVLPRVAHEFGVPEWNERVVTF